MVDEAARRAEPGGVAGERPLVNIVGERVALGPLRRELLPLHERWINDFATVRNIGGTPRPVTAEQEVAWRDRQAGAEGEIAFTIYARAGWRPLGTTALHAVDHRLSIRGWKCTRASRPRCTTCSRPNCTGERR